MVAVVSSDPSGYRCTASSESRIATLSSDTGKIYHSDIGAPLPVKVGLRLKVGLRQVLFISIGAPLPVKVGLRRSYFSSGIRLGSIGAPLPVKVGLRLGLFKPIDNDVLNRCTASSESRIATSQSFFHRIKLE